MTRPTPLHVALTAAVLLLMTGAMPNSAGAPSGRTGAPGSQTCADGCHTGNPLNAAGGRALLSAPASYIPGTPVDLSLRVEREGMLRFGFSITVQDAGGNMVGTWEPVPGQGTALSEFGGDPTHVTHDPAVAVLDGHTWLLRWIPPAEDAGPVTFYAAGNAANGFGNFGDFIYTTSSTLQSAAGTGTEWKDQLLPLRVTSVYPMPAGRETTFDIHSDRSAAARIHLYDASGRRVMTSDESLAPGQNRISLSLDTLPIGWYAWRVEAAGHSRTGTLTVAR
ncbi:MAG: T9SS type A sorting domain-containing protein [Bacteroidetes bacterium]|nr:T9SS type A sorting domain-containing protein [Bacteroidota bacterium]